MDFTTFMATSLPTFVQLLIEARKIYQEVASSGNDLQLRGLEIVMQDFQGHLKLDRAEFETKKKELRKKVDDACESK